MPYFITDQSDDCDGWATVKEDGEVIGCHETKEAAIDQMIAVSLAEEIEPGGELPSDRVVQPEEPSEERVLVDVPDYVQAAAAKGLTYYEQGLAGDGLQAETVEEARQLRAGRVQDEKVTRLRAWVLRHRGDWEGVARNSDASDPDFPGPGAVAAYLWGRSASYNGRTECSPHLKTKPGRPLT